MKTTTTLIRIASAALATSLMFAATAASAADSSATKTELPRVVVTGKSAGPAPVVQQLPRVVVSGLSVNTQMQQLMLAAAKSDGKAARRNG
ncbi:MAG: hypothetical protein CFE41_04870 [Burkholderiales bacterium PBB2]|nr:hypothetical protein [Roseateles sp.]OYU28630.1 MAG: hypothetical protein CFE41_04870 [Burkholderiales bacterium PBB2]